MKTQCFFQHFLPESCENTRFFNGLGASEFKVMNPQKITKNLRFLNVFSARRTFAMGPRMAQALKNQENSMLFTIVYTKIKKTMVSPTFLCPRRRPRQAHWGPEWARCYKNQENSVFLTTVYAKIKKTRWFCLLFSAPIDDLARLTGLLVDRRNNLKK